MKLYKKSQDRIDRDLNVYSIIQTLKQLKVVLKNSIFTDKIKYETVHSYKCIIDLDS